ncbi:hypothetical protein ABVK25_011982 [Lepraria finkii]|uniref:CRAL-TRIO domain-containing protein n=1 Tax=Lepraria finkii TaxID=1340010 RepID=A0ABR4AK58_9LECA
MATSSKHPLSLPGPLSRKTGEIVDIINAPWGFSGAFNFVKGFLDPVTVAKIHVLGTGYEKELLEQIPAENLPKPLGGTCECEGGCEHSDDGPWKDPKWVKEPKWAKKQMRKR